MIIFNSPVMCKETLHNKSTSYIANNSFFKRLLTSCIFFTYFNILLRTRDHSSRSSMIWSLPPMMMLSAILQQFANLIIILWLWRLFCITRSGQRNLFGEFFLRQNFANNFLRKLPKKGKFLRNHKLICFLFVLTDVTKQTKTQEKHQNCP